MLVSLTVGKVDAGVTVLLTQDKRLVSRVFFLAPCGNKHINRGLGRLRIASCVLFYQSLITLLDRISLHSSPTRHFLRFHCRHYSCAQHILRVRSRAALPSPAGQDLQCLWRCTTLYPHPTMPQCDADLCCPRVGPHSACDRRPDQPLPVPQQQQGWHHPEASPDAHYKDLWLGSRHKVHLPPGAEDNRWHIHK